ncbi:MAG: nickel pincer cofactor biosynthesis protein LarC [Gemmatimonadota bacterium]|jgi:hypothetical protein
MTVSRGGAARRWLIFDPFAGIAGDMIVAALIDLGLETTWLRDFVASLGLGEVGVRVERVTRRGIACPHVTFDLPVERSHRHLRHVLEIIEAAAVPEGVRATAGAVFRRLAEAEAEVHGTTPDQVHFHEVGALDAILDVLCVVAGIDRLGYGGFFTRPVAVGQGWVEIEHGTFPVPAPATLKLLEGFEVSGLELEGECTTPTGAALLAELTGGRPAPASFRVGRTAHGAGTRDPADRPNVLRVIEADADPRAGDAVYMIQTDLDDLSPEYAPPALDAILAAGALDASLIALHMKKGRPGLRLEALSGVAALPAVLEAIFRHSPSIGLRYWPVTRPALPRRETVVRWRGQTIRHKMVTLPDGAERAKPEYEDVRRAAEALGIPLLDVLRDLAGPDPAT